MVSDEDDEHEETMDAKKKASPTLASLLIASKTRLFSWLSSCPSFLMKCISWRSRRNLSAGIRVLQLRQAVLENEEGG